ncbi:MAG: nucleotidyltransferase family protein [Clostridia bacterium]|nr:nucleotidyltransferase family protein [Clostridia bacterium]
MKTAGIIAEYNPFHNGHAHHIQKTRDAGAQAVVCVMSGCFVQRGEPAVMLPKARAEMALKNGADLVISLPLPWSCAGAQTFAHGAVSLFDALGCVDMLSFGSECGDIKVLKQAASAVDDYAVRENLKSNLLLGMNFASARQSAIEDISPEVAHILSNPNDTLAVEYIRELMLSNSSIEPFAVSRKGVEHDSEKVSESYASASLIRSILKDDKDASKLIPQTAADILKSEVSKGQAPADISRLETAILAKLRTMSAEDIAKSPDVSEGLENRIYSAVREATSLEELYSLAKTKRYSHARIRRVVMNTFLGVTSKDCEGEPPYIRVLGFTPTGRELLKTMKDSASLPIVMRAADVSKLGERAKRIFSLEAAVADIFALALPKPLPCGMEYTGEIIMAD